jgi:hypothetical protein
LQESARWCTPSSLGLGLGLGLLVPACLFLLSFLSLVLVLLLFVLEALVRLRDEFVGIASVAPAGHWLLNAMCGLSFCGRVETNFDAFVSHGCEESVDAVDDAIGCLGIEEAGVYEALGDSLLSSEDLLALEASYVGKSRVVTALCVRTAASCTSHARAISAAVAVVERVVAIVVSSAASAAA